MHRRATSDNILETHCRQLLPERWSLSTNILPHKIEISSSNPTKVETFHRDLYFHPEHLNFGPLKINWTEYLDEHLTFDLSSITVNVYWFASHIDCNESYQYVLTSRVYQFNIARELQFRLFLIRMQSFERKRGCNSHNKTMELLSAVADLTYLDEVRQSYV